MVDRKNVLYEAEAIRRKVEAWKNLTFERHTQ